MSTDITLDTFHAESLFGSKIAVGAEATEYEHYDRDVTFSVEGTHDMLLPRENARALGFALIAAAASLEWTT